MGYRVTKRNCIICGEPVPDGKAVWCSGADVHGDYAGYQAMHEAKGTVAVKLQSRNPKGVMHLACLEPHLLKTKLAAAKKEERAEALRLKKENDHRILRDDHWEWDR